MQKLYCGISELNNSLQLDLFPNPAGDQLTIKFISTGNKETTYEILDTFGRIVFKKNVGPVPDNTIEQINLSGIACGLYMLRVSEEGVSSVKKFVKN